jgi:mannose-1-phosphate guanylyltransferase
MQKYAIIMAGGSGTRLWPLSRKSKPKQFLDILGQGSFLEQSINRLTGLFPRENILVMGSMEQQKLLSMATNGYLSHKNVLLEPVARNTAACIALATHNVLRAGDALMCILPADHYISDEMEFRSALLNGLHAAEDSECIVTMGIIPTMPAIGYGYIKAGDFLKASYDARHVLRFVEKPKLEQAIEYLQEGTYYWNSGVFFAKASVMEEEIKKFLPEMHEMIQMVGKSLHCGLISQAYNEYANIEAISIDYGVIEKSERLLMVPGHFKWSDMGDFDALREIVKQDKQGNAILKGRLMGVNASNITLYSDKKLVVVTDIQDIIIVETQDLLYLCRMGSSQKTKDIVKEIGQAGFTDLE